MFNKILIANRGEIALRVVRAAARWAWHRRGAFHRRCRRDACAHGRRGDLHRPAALARNSYLSMAAIMSACEITGAEAIHPGYGFLSENANFVQASRITASSSSAPRPSISA
jgi:acetyl-CoA carboxylase biotin carboxylase subunit